MFDFFYLVWVLFYTLFMFLEWLLVINCLTFLIVGRVVICYCIWFLLSGAIYFHYWKELKAIVCALIPIFGSALPSFSNWCNNSCNIFLIVINLLLLVVFFLVIAIGVYILAILIIWWSVWLLAGLFGCGIRIFFCTNNFGLLA